MKDALSLTDRRCFGQGKLRQDDVITMLGVVGRDEITTLMEALKEGLRRCYGTDAELLSETQILPTCCQVYGGRNQRNHDHW